MAGQISSRVMRLAFIGIRKVFPTVKQLDTAKLEEFMEGNKYKNLILLDVREKNEFDVSRLPNSIHVEPEEPVDQVMMKIKQRLQDIQDQHVKIVSYCALGVRASRMATKLHPEFKRMKEQQTVDIDSELYNLEGAIFKWANEKRELVDCNNKKTQYCHPFNYMFGKLLHPRIRKYEPASKEV